MSGSFSPGRLAVMPGSLISHVLRRHLQRHRRRRASGSRPWRATRSASCPFGASSWWVRSRPGAAHPCAVISRTGRPSGGRELADPHVGVGKRTAPGLARVDAQSGYCAVQPPSTGRIAPVTRPDARDDRNTTAAATSAVVPTRPMGIRARTPARNAGSSSRSAVPGGVDSGGGDRVDGHAVAPTRARGPWSRGSRRPCSRSRPRGA